MESPAEQTLKLFNAMVHYDEGDAMRIQHFTKVWTYARMMGLMLQLPADVQLITETAAIVHDIGIHMAEKKHGSSNGKYQEIEGPAEARKLLQQVGGYTEEQIQRVEYLVGHHHTYAHIDGVDYQLLVEADFLVNLYEDNVSHDGAMHARDHIFKTKPGLQLFDEMYATKYVTPTEKQM